MNNQTCNGEDMAIIGLDLTPAECELRAMSIHPQHREGEADLIASRWFDYSALHPTQATYLFAHHYKFQTRIFFETYIDLHTAEDALAFTPEDIFASRDITSMWLARREADRHGMPYPFVLQFAQACYVRKLFHRFPRPNQLYPEEFVMELTAAWQERLARSLTYGKHPMFRVQQWAGTEVQKRHLAFVVDQIKRRPSSPRGLLARMFHESVLSPQLVKADFSQEDIDAAIEQAKMLG